MRLWGPLFGGAFFFKWAGVHDMWVFDGVSCYVWTVFNGGGLWKGLDGFPTGVSPKFAA